VAVGQITLAGNCVQDCRAMRSGYGGELLVEVTLRVQWWWCLTDGHDYVFIEVTSTRQTVQ
jgi:hypothetical protein